MRSLLTVIALLTMFALFSGQTTEAQIQTTDKRLIPISFGDITVLIPIEVIGTDAVISLESGLGLTGKGSTDLALQEAPSGHPITALSGNNANVFADLYTAICPGFCLVGFNTYKNYVDATFWYQSAPGGWSGEGYIDGAFTGDSAIMLHASVTLMTWVLAERMDDLMSCAAPRTTSWIPDRYVFTFTDGISLVPHTRLDTEKLKRDLEAMFFFDIPHSAHIAIGAFNNPQKDDSSIKLGVTWLKPLDSYPHGEKDLSNITTIGSVLIGINLNVHSDALLTLGRSAGTIFHEILHNFGFGHNDNNLSSYTDRTKAIFALEDCMCNIVREIVNQGDLDSLIPGTVWAHPSNLGTELACRG